MSMVDKRWIASELGREYKICGELGKGGFATVYAVESAKNKNEKYALKVIEIDEGENCAYRVKIAKQEINFLKQFTGEHFTKMHKYFAVKRGDKEVICILLKRYESVKILTVMELVRLGVDICEALKVVHNAKILFRDVKPANILWDQNNQKYILADFGAARYLDDAQEQVGDSVTRIGCWDYMAPELRSGKDTVSLNADIYSLGVTLKNLLATIPEEERIAFRCRDLERSIKLATACKEIRYQSIDEMEKSLRSILTSEKFNIESSENPKSIQANKTQRKEVDVKFLGRMILFSLVSVEVAFYMKSKMLIFPLYGSLTSDLCISLGMFSGIWVINCITFCWIWRLSAWVIALILDKKEKEVVEQISERLTNVLVVLNAVVFVLVCL